MTKFSFKKLIFFLLIFSCAGELIAQTNVSGSQPDECGCEARPLPEVLAVVNGIKFTKNDISPQTAEQIRRLQQEVTSARKNELNFIINSKLLEAEAKTRGVTPAQLLEHEVVQKVKEPTEAEAQAFYEQNKARLEGDFQSLKNVIINHLRNQKQQEEAKNFADRLRAAAGVKMLVEFATPPAAAADRARVFAHVNSVPITSADVEDNLRPLIYSVQQQVYELRKNDINLKINDALLNQEAQKRKITTGQLLELEVNKKVPLVTEAQAQTFYNQNKNRINGEFQQIKQQIIEYLQEEEKNKASKAFAAQLRNAASLEIFLTEPEPPVYNIPMDDQPVKGSPAAPVTIVEFIDFQCSNCAESHNVLNRLFSEYQGKIKIVLLDYPLRQHANAFKAAEAAEAARQQGKYWEYAEILLRNQGALEISKLKEYASQINLDRQKFDSALDAGLFAEKVRRDLEEGNKIGVMGTPTIFINGRLVADWSYEALKAAIEKQLKGQK